MKPLNKTAGGTTNRARVESFHLANPHVYSEIVKLAREAREVGMPRWSMAGIFEVLRWRSAIGTRGGGWKLPNAYRAYYARLVMDRCPDLRGFFVLKSQKGEPHE
jgi:hypothetical protein